MVPIPAATPNHFVSLSVKEIRQLHDCIVDDIVDYVPDEPALERNLGMD